MDADEALLRDDLAGAALTGQAEAPAEGSAGRLCPGCPRKAEWFALRQQAAFYKSMHERRCERVKALEEKVEELEAKVRLREQELFGRKSEQSQGLANSQGALPMAAGPRNPRGHRRGTPGHGRKSYAHLPVKEEWLDLPAGQGVCDRCGLPFVSNGDSEDSEQVAVEVHAYRRLYRRRRYRPACQCAHLPAVIVAPPPPKLIPKGRYDITVWVQVLLGKYLFVRPLGRVLADLATVGLKLSAGTVTDGLRRIAPVFEPVMDEIVTRNLQETQWHADETRWRVFEPVEGKVGSMWWLWVFLSASAVVFVLDPSRSVRVPEAFFQGVEFGYLIVDRYVVYKVLTAVKLGNLLLVFCWQHVRRDFLDVARGWPAHKAWGLEWVGAIGELVHLNHLRLEVLDDAAAFAPRDAALRQAVERMAARRDAELAQDDLHPVRRKVLESLQTHWHGLTLFVDHPELPMDNSAAERQLRDPALCRKIFYGSVAVWAGHLAATLFSIFGTLELWDINPLLWLTAYLDACARNGGQPPPDAAAFLPWNLSEERRREFANRPSPDT
jgi:transposase